MLFSVQKEKRKLSFLFPLFLLILVLLIFIVACRSVNSTNSVQEKAILGNALDRSITQCYALEGSYPPSLSYLEDNYGLTYDHQRYFIDYQYIGDNLRPDTTIIERD
jgi:hypothetical protein